jgi:hypothetical protein
MISAGLFHPHFRAFPMRAETFGFSNYQKAGKSLTANHAKYTNELADVQPLDSTLRLPPSGG